MRLLQNEYYYKLLITWPFPDLIPLITIGHLVTLHRCKQYSNGAFPVADMCAAK